MDVLNIVAYVTKQCDVAAGFLIVTGFTLDVSRLDLTSSDPTVTLSGNIIPRSHSVDFARAFTVDR